MSLFLNKLDYLNIKKLWSGSDKTQPEPDLNWVKLE